MISLPVRNSNQGQTIKILLLSFFIFGSLITNLEARHIVGGDMTYRCLGINTALNEFEIQVTLVMYRDGYQGGGQITPFDNEARIGIHRGSGNNWSFVNQLAVPLSASNPIPPVSDPCVQVPPNLIVDSGVYEFVLRLPILATDTYMISYQRCCRNNTIANLQSPGQTGAAFSIEIIPEAQAACNSSPVFNGFPPIVICNDIFFDFDHSASDLDGDDIIYSFCTPLDAGGDNTSASASGDCNSTIPDPSRCIPPYRQVRYVIPTYSATRPVTGLPDLTIDSQTGVITGKPNLQGQFVVGVCATEYRNGIKIGEIRRDFQFNVSLCEPNLFATVMHDAEIGPQNYRINSCGRETINFTNQSTDQRFIQSYFWEFQLEDGSTLTSSEKSPSLTFPGIGQYPGKMWLNPGTECTDSAELEVFLFPSIEADFSSAFDTCIAGPTRFNDLSVTLGERITNWDWDFGDGGTAFVKNPTYQFADAGRQEVNLKVTDNNLCETDTTINIDWNPVPPLIIIEPSTFVGCRPANIFFNNLSEPINDDYIITWDFGDGNMGDDISPTHEYTEKGVYSVGVEITSPIGCMTSRFFPNWIRIDDRPEADFTFSPEIPNTFNTSVQFTDQSINAVSWFWNFDGEANAFERNPTYTFRDTGQHVVDLIVVHPSGCADTMTQIVDVIPIVDFTMPSAFTPNADSRNDIFRGKGITDGMREYEMVIFSRWGEVVFQSEDPTEGWNGKKDNTGADLPGGVYVYKLSYLTPRGETIPLKGYATLIR